MTVGIELARAMGPSALFGTDVLNAQQAQKMQKRALISGQNGFPEFTVIPALQPLEVDMEPARIQSHKQRESTMGNAR